MTKEIFCYYCRAFHTPEMLRKVTTKTGTRWRCLRSLEAAKRSREERDNFGRQQSEANRAAAQKLAERQAYIRMVEQNDYSYRSPIDMPAHESL